MDADGYAEQLEREHAGRVLGTWYLASEGVRPSTRYKVPSISVSTTHKSRPGSGATLVRGYVVTLLRVVYDFFHNNGFLYGRGTE